MEGFVLVSLSFLIFSHFSLKWKERGRERETKNKETKKKEEEEETPKKVRKGRKKRGIV